MNDKLGCLITISNSSLCLFHGTYYIVLASQKFTSCQKCVNPCYLSSPKALRTLKLISTNLKPGIHRDFLDRCDATVLLLGYTQQSDPKRRFIAPSYLTVSDIWATGANKWRLVKNPGIHVADATQLNHLVASHCIYPPLGSWRHMGIFA